MPRAKGPRAASISTSKMATVKSQLADTTQLAEANLVSAMERGEALQNIAAKTEGLQSAAGQFTKNTKQAERRTWLETVSYTTWFAFILVIVVFCVFVFIMSLISWRRE